MVGGEEEAPPPYIASHQGWGCSSSPHCWQLWGIGSSLGPGGGRGGYTRGGRAGCSPGSNAGAGSGLSITRAEQRGHGGAGWAHGTPPSSKVWGQDAAIVSLPAGSEGMGGRGSPHPWEKGRKGLGMQDVVLASLLSGYQGTGRGTVQPQTPPPAAQWWQDAVPPHGKALVWPPTPKRLPRQPRD